MWAVIMYEPPNRDSCQHNICSAVCFEYMLAAYFEHNENNSGGIQPLLLITIEICAYINCQGLVFDIKGSRLCCILEKFVWWNLLYRIISPRGYVCIYIYMCVHLLQR